VHWVLSLVVSSWTSSSDSSLSLTSLWHSSVLVVSSHIVLLWLLLHKRQQLLDNVSKVWLVRELGPGEGGSSLLRNVLLPVSLVSDLRELQVTDFLDLVMVDDETLSVVGLSLELGLGHGAGIWLLVADEGVGVVLVSLLESHSLDFSVGLEEVGELNFGPGSWEVLDVQVASLLGVLVSDGLLELLLLSLWLVQELSAIELLSIAHVLVVQFGDGLVDGIGSVSLVLVVLVFVAHESELSHVVLEGNEGLDGTMWLEHLLDLFLGVFLGDILEVQVVDELLGDISGVLGVESEDFSGLLKGLEALVGALLFFEADEGEPSVGVVNVEGDLGALDWSEGLELLVDVLVGHDVLGEFLGVLVEHVVGHDLGLGLSSEFLVEWEGSDLAVVDGEVSHLLLGFFVRGVVFDVHDGRVEWLEQVSVDLWFLGSDLDAGALEGFSELDGGHVLLGEVV